MNDALLEARGLTARLQQDTALVAVLDRIDFALAPAEIVDVVGPSGSGKSTLLRALARLLPTGDGHLFLDGSPAEDHTPQEWRSLVTLVPQKPAIIDGTVRDNLLLPWRLKVRHGRHAPADEALSHGMGALSVDVALDRDASRLSVGQQARVALLRVMLSEPRVLLLDEADAALDDESAAAVARLVVAFTARGGAVIRVRHRADDGSATRRLRLQHGRLEEVS